MTQCQANKSPYLETSKCWCHDCVWKSARLACISCYNNALLTMCTRAACRVFGVTRRLHARVRVPSSHAMPIIVKPMIANWKMIVNWRTLFAFFRLSTSDPFTNYRSFQLKLLLWPHCLFIKCVVTVVRRILNDEIYFITNRFFLDLLIIIYGLLLCQ